MVATTHLIAGSDFLARYPGFRLIGRDEDLNRLSSILMRRSANSVLLSGPAGVGTTALCLGLQALKSDPNAPFDIVEKRLFWLDTDSLFSTGNTEEIRTNFDATIKELWDTPESVLIIEDTRDFIEASRNSGNQHFINALTLAVKSSKTQVILETRDPDIDFVIKWHSDIRESYTLLDLTEPAPEHLLPIVTEIAAGLSAFHRIHFNPKAIAKAVNLTMKYPVDEGGLSRAQPDRSKALLDRAAATFRLTAHQSTPIINDLEAEYAAASDAEKPAVLARLTDARTAWAALQDKIKRLYGLQRKGEKEIIRLNREKEAQIEREKEAREKREQELRETGVISETSSTPQRGFGAILASAGESAAVAEISAKIRLYQGELAKNKSEFEDITAQINAELELTEKDVTAEFSRITGISGDKLNEDDIAVLRRLDTDLQARVFGQDEPIQRVVNAIRVAKIGKRNGDRPIGSFMFIGPSGVGKTEVAKVIAKSNLGDEKALLRFDMSEYMEKHSVAKLIGAPPGYELAEAGGILTNAMRKNRRRVILFDEIEKGHPDVFNVMLQVLDDGRLTDNLGRVADFSEAIIIMTSNIGQAHFLDQDLTYEGACNNAMTDLEGVFRPEFLNRFAGRENIIGFNRLALDSIERIVRREITNIDRAYSHQGIRADLPDTDLKEFCEQRYEPKVGARGLPGIIQAGLEPIIVNKILETGGARGVFDVRYDSGRRRFAASFREDANAVAA